jgi:hypothetical protein
VYEAKLKEEERLREEEQKRTGKAAPASKAAPKKGGKDEKPVLDVPKLPIPQVTFFLSEIGNKYVRERTFDELSAKMMEAPAAEGEEKQVDQRTSTALSVHKSSD